MSDRYNFKDINIQKKAIYKLFMSFKDGSTQRMYGFYRKPDAGLDMLKKLVEKNKSKLKIALLYNNQTNELIETLYKDENKN